MAATVLGKRTRGALEGAASPAAITRASKRRIVLDQENLENENPFIKHNESETPAKKTRSPRTAPAKHGSPGQRIALSPSKISAHFKSGKTAVEVYQDGKRETEQPATPRHRDALSKKVPITPRHRVTVGGCQFTPKTPRTPHTPSAAIPVYNQARQLFSRCSNPGRLVGRDVERQQLAGFVERCVASKSAGCIYVSGPPGTGKSALLDEVCQRYHSAENIDMSVVNCMSVRNAKDLSGKLSEDLGLQEDAGFEYLQSCFLRGKAKDAKKYLVILDEVDCLVDLDLSLLYSLFEWSMHASSRLILIGIANALDLTDRFLPRLKSRDLQPELLPFMPYSAAQIAQVLMTKLKTLAPDEATIPFLHPAAVQFCAKKVASQTGDLRKAFDICRRAIDAVEQETKERDAQTLLMDSPSKTPLMENINLASPTTPRSALKGRSTTIYTTSTAPKATIAHMAKITAQVFSNGTTQRLGSLNLQQKAVLCALSALEARNRTTQPETTMFGTPSKANKSAPSVKQLFEAYSKLCKRDKLLHPLSSVEFRDVVSGLEALSLLVSVDGKNGSFAPVTPLKTPSRRSKNGFGAVLSGDERRVASAVGVKELSGTLEGAGGELLRDILEGDALLG